MTRLLICAGLWLSSATPVAMAEDGSDDENLLKAAFIYNFALFTHWPENAPEEKGAPLSLCIAGEDDLAIALGRLRGKLVQGRPLTIQTLKDVRVPRNCHMLYVATSEKESYPNLVKAMRARPILTVSELPKFAHAGGVFELYRENGRIRFIINLGVARKAGLEISPKLLNLAVVISAEQL